MPPPLQRLTSLVQCQVQGQHGCPLAHEHSLAADAAARRSRETRHQLGGVARFERGHPLNLLLSRRRLGPEPRIFTQEAQLCLEDRRRRTVNQSSARGRSHL